LETPAALQVPAQGIENPNLNLTKEVHSHLGMSHDNIELGKVSLADDKRSRAPSSAP